MIRILHSVSNMDRAGIETMLMNYYRYMDKSKVQFDFLCNKKKPGAYDDEIKSMGGRIYHTPGLNPAKYPVYLKYMRELFQEHPEYKIVEAHNGALGVYALHAAKVSKIPVRIFHAPSVGAVTEETAVPEDVFSGLKHLDRISGRDVESLKFVERACGRKAEKMLDPTFLYNFDMDIERENIKPKPYRYILIYDCKLTEPMAKQLQEYAKKNDLKIIGAGDYKTFYDEGFIDLTPYEWVDLFRNAEKVITGTFHGTVFSIKYNKSVLCYPTEKNRINKIRSLLSDMKIASRLLEVGCEDDFIPLLDTPMDYTETRNYIAQKIQEADDFLTGDKS